jgi:hypothetical protein
MQSIVVNGFTHNYQSIIKGIPDINIVAICGCGGGFSGPAYLYDNIMTNPFDNFTFTRIDIAYPYDKDAIYSSKLHFNQSVDVVVTISRLIYAENNKPIVLIGWSMGGAVVIETGYKLQKEIKVRGIITISSQSAHIKNLKNLNSDIYKLFIHGDKDLVLNDKISKYLYEQVNTRKMLQIIKDGDHFLSGNEKYLYELVKNVIASMEL